jgi:hypothetical protein
MMRCLIISPHFPPSTLAGVHRARHLAKHLPNHGWEPTIICVNPERYIEQLDPELAKLVPTTVKVVKAGALSVAMTRPFGLVGDIGLRGFFHLRSAIARSIGANSPDAVLITGSPFYPMLLAGWIKRRWDIPVVLDFQDPWVSAEGARRQAWTKEWVAHRLAVAMEPKVVTHADFITSVSERQNDEIVARYSFLDRSRMAAIPIGGDPDDFVSLRENAPKDMQVRLSPGLKHIVYVGAFLPRAEPLVRVLFQALRMLLAEQPGLASKVKLTFVGTSNQPSGIGGGRVKPIAEAEGVGDLVNEHPPRVPFLEALSLLANADVLMMIGSDEPHYTASKIYPNLMAARPYLSIFHAASSAHTILSEAGGGAAFAFDGADGLDLLAEPIKIALGDLIDRPEQFGKPNPEAYAPYTAHAVAEQFADVLEKVVL